MPKKKFDSRILVGNCLDTLKTLEDCSISSIVTDPPYELGFMGKSWDASGIAYNVEMWRECLRVLKPGGHLLAFGGTRTYHRMAVAIEDAGFEIRDSIHWVYGSGFPKSMDVSKAIDKAAGAEREVTGSKKTNVGMQGGNFTAGSKTASVAITAPATDAAKQWQGWGTALKPAHEPIVMARKPLTGTVAANVLEHGTGALNIDGCRISAEPGTIPSVKGTKRSGGILGKSSPRDEASTPHTLGRWPANIIFDKAAGAELDAQAAIEAARFFYCPKPSKKERNAGLDGFEEVRSGVERMNNSNGRKKELGESDRLTLTKNFHPTVKPLELIRYLTRLVTPPGGIVLDPFLGSGTTAIAATIEGFDWRGCEMTKEYLPIIQGRITWAATQIEQPKLF